MKEKNLWLKLTSTKSPSCGYIGERKQNISFSLSVSLCLFVSLFFSLCSQAVFNWMVCACVRLALFTYHLNFVRLIDDEELQKKLIFTNINPLPDNYNPISKYHVPTCEILRIRMKAIEPSLQEQFKLEAVDNLSRHVSDLEALLTLSTTSSSSITTSSPAISTCTRPWETDNDSEREGKRWFLFGGKQFCSIETKVSFSNLFSSHFNSKTTSWQCQTQSCNNVGSNWE